MQTSSTYEVIMVLMNSLTRWDAKLSRGLIDDDSSTSGSLPCDFRNCKCSSSVKVPNISSRLMVVFMIATDASLVAA